MVSQNIIRPLCAVGLMLAGLISINQAQAAAQDYKFELVSAKPLGGGKNAVSVRLIHLPDGAPVSGALIIASKTDMAPSGMADMTGGVATPPREEAGVYQFLTENGMAGDWSLTLTAKVQGEPQTVKGVVTYKAAVK